MYDVILKSGYVLKDVKPKDNTKSPIGLFIWSHKQKTDQILSFENMAIDSSQIAAIIDLEGNDTADSLRDATDMLNNIDKQKGEF